MKARVIDKEGHLELIGDPASADLHPGDEVEVVRPDEQPVRPFLTIRGLWKGVRISPEDLAEVRAEMRTSLTADGGG